LIEGRCPAYITPERFWTNQERLAANQCKAKGACREGASLLGGLLVCGRCGRRMVIQYAGKAKNLRYLCNRAKGAYADPVCLNIAGSGLDAFVTNQILAALRPAALELSLAAAADWEAERQRLETHWRQQLERAQYEVDRAARSYQAVEPENRLVSHELERRWEAALREQQILEEGFARFRRQRPGELTEAQRQQIRLLAQDVPALWHARTTSWAERQQIVRLLIEQVVIRVEGQSEQAQLTIRWAGGYTSQHAFTRSLNRYEDRSDFQDLCKRVAALRDQGLTHAAVAEQLNSEGFRPLKRRTVFTGKMVADLLAKQVRPESTNQADGLKADEWLLADLARKVGMPTVTLRLWIRWGWVHARRLPLPNGPWAIWADDEELARMRQLRQCSRASSAAQSWRALTTPKPRGSA
jgi:Recombinase zinc beta ribbon domain